MMGKSGMIQKERIKVLNRKGIQEGKYILYWMQASQRVEYNHALEFAISTVLSTAPPADGGAR